MLRIRLQRRGRRKRPIHHIVVADNRKPRDGRIIEDLGRFDNVTPKNQLDLDRERALYWLKQGAQPSDTVRSIFKNQGIMYEMHLIRWGKSDEEIEEALAEWREKRAEKEEEVPTRKERQKALLEAEEKEFQKQLKKKAEEAAREKAKQEALASDEEEEAEEETTAKEAETAEEETVEAEEAEEVEAADESEETTEAEEAAEEEVEEAAAAEATEEESDEDEDVAAEEAEAKEEAAETPEEEVEEEDNAEKAEGQLSTDMLAKEAIEHIENTPLEDLEGFVPEDEDRVTVQRALEDKKENN